VRLAGSAGGLFRPDVFTDLTMPTWRTGTRPARPSTRRPLPWSAR